MKAKGDKMLYPLQGLRTVGFLMIFFGHTQLASTDGGGVELFILLSGFVMMLSHGGDCMVSSVTPSIKYGITRVKRLYPLHIITMIVAIPFLIYTYMLNPTVKQIGISIFSLVTNVTLTQSWVPRIRIYFALNSVSWYLSNYLFMMACFPFICSKIRGISLRKACIMMISTIALQIGVGIGSTILFGDFDKSGITEWLVYINPIMRLCDFCIGCCAYIFYREIRNYRLSFSMATACEILSLVLLCTVQYMVSCEVWLGKTFLREGIIYGPVMVILIVLCSMGKGLISRFLSLKPIIWIAELTPYLYLIHQLVIRYFDSFERKIIHIELQPLLFALICLVCSVIGSIIYKEVEDYINRRETSGKIQ